MIPFESFKTINALYDDAIKVAVLRVIDSGEYIMSEEVHSFEREFADFVGVHHAIGVANGLEALCIALRALKIGSGDEVIVPANTFIATILSISEVGATPVLVDADIRTGNIDIRLIESAITEKTRAIMPVHLYGRSCEMDAILDITQRYRLKVIEDCAQAHGAYFGDRQVGAMGDIGAFSFYPSKNLGAMGDGGIITTNNEELAGQARIIRGYGMIGGGRHLLQGMNSRLDEIQAAILRAKLPHLHTINQIRRNQAEYYLSEIKNPAMILPVQGEEKSSVWNYFPVQSEWKDDILEYLGSHEIECHSHYTIPPHKQVAYEQLNHLSFPVTEEIHNKTFYLPVSEAITDENVRYISQVCNQYQPHSWRS